MKLTLEDKRAVCDQIDKRVVHFAPNAEGRKNWLIGGGFSFEPTPHNLELWKRTFPEVAVVDNRSNQEVHPHAALFEPTKPFQLYHPKSKPYAHQERAVIKLGPLPYFAILMEQGTGKTFVLITVAGMRWLAGDITGLVVFTKKGVHNQWIDEQLPEHLSDQVPWSGHAWTGKAKKVPEHLFHADGPLRVLAMNVDAPSRAKEARAILERFAQVHGRKIMCIVDESQDIKDLTTSRAQAILAFGTGIPQGRGKSVIDAFGPGCDFRAISTGTPIAKDLTDEWAQFKFLSEEIIGHRYLSTFRATYCKMGGFENRSVVGHQNLEQFVAKTEPWSFRVTKDDELDLPPKVYDKIVFELSDIQRQHYDELKNNFLVELEQGVATVANAAVAVTRLQQVASGYLVLEDGQIVDLPNPRMDALLEGIEHRSGKMIIWARFNRDIENILKVLGSGAVHYYGATSTGDRERAKELFLNPNSGKDFFVSNPAAGGTGLNLQGLCRTNFYYTNSFNAVQRWQSEDRTHRIGTTGTVSYFDLTARATVDVKILANLRAKKDLSTLVLDDIRKVFEE